MSQPIHINQPKRPRESPRKMQKPAPRGLAALGMVLGTVLKKFAAALRSVRIQRRPRRMQLLERHSLGGKQSVLLLRVDSYEFVVGCTGESMVLLGMNESIPDSLNVPTAEQLVQAFRSVQ